VAEQEDLNTPLIALVGFIGAVIVFVIVLLLAAIYRGFETRLHFERDTLEPYTEVTDLTSRQRGDLASYGWVDEEKGLVSIPIGRAIELAVHEIRTGGSAAVTRPGETRPGETRPGETQPGETQPDETQPDETQPGDTQPDRAQPGEAGGSPAAKPEEPQTINAAEEADDAKLE